MTPFFSSVFPQLHTNNLSVLSHFHTISPSAILKTTLVTLVCCVVRLNRTFHFSRILTPYLRSCAIIPISHQIYELVWVPFEQKVHFV